MADRKAAALREHRTQANDMADLPEEVERRLLSRETHVVAWPAHAPGARVLSDVFEDLQ